MIRPLVVLSAVMALGLAALDAQQMRDQRRFQTSGTGSISGVVVSDDRDARPLRRARVTLSAVTLEFARVEITGDDGAFSFTDLPAGRYSLRAAKEAYLPGSVGARRAGAAGTGIELRAGEAVRTRLPLTRGGVITGRLLDGEGAPAAGVTVRVFARRYEPMSGERLLIAPPRASSVTDDRGVYRIYGLTPDDYFVCAEPRIPSSPETPFQIVSPEEIRAALAEVKGASTSPRPGQIPRGRGPAAGGAPPRRSVGAAPVCFPGTPVGALATAIRIAPGDVRQGVDFDIAYVAVATVSGFAVAPPGTNRVQLTLSPSDPLGRADAARFVSAGEDGRFSFRNVVPGRYTIAARTIAASGPGVPQTTSSASTEVVINGDDLEGVALNLQPGVTISGRVVFESEQQGAPVLPALQVPLQARNISFGAMVLAPQVRVQGETFEIRDVVPGRYRLLPSALRGIRTPVGPWWLTSIRIGNRELLDSELEIRESTTDAVVTFSDRASELSGAVTLPNGTALGGEGHVVVFSRDPAGWFHNSRRVVGISPAADGRYVVRNLPPGDYLVAVTFDLEPNGWFDPEALKDLAPLAIPVRIAPGTITTQDVVVTQ